VKSAEVKAIRDVLGLVITLGMANAKLIPPRNPHEKLIWRPFATFLNAINPKHPSQRILGTGRMSNEERHVAKFC
jgi:hypothetical protein